LGIVEIERGDVSGVAIGGRCDVTLLAIGAVFAKGDRAEGW
jgi:hypothetical protein